MMGNMLKNKVRKLTWKPGIIIHYNDDGEARNKHCLDLEKMTKT